MLGMKNGRDGCFARNDKTRVTIVCHTERSEVSRLYDLLVSQELPEGSIIL